MSVATNPPPGTVVGWGSVMFPYVEPGTVFTNISAGANHNLAFPEQLPDFIE